MTLSWHSLLTRSLDRLGLAPADLPASYVDPAAPLPSLAVAEVPPAPAPPGLAAAMEAPEAAEGPFGLDQLAGLPLTVEHVEQVLDELVRPALNADGGDITLHRIDEEGNVYVRLVGSCSTCPSSIMTMRMGVERLLQEEFPSMNELIQVDGLG